MLLNLYISVLSGVICFTCIFLVLHKDYEDGFIGRLGLALLGIAAGGRCMDAIMVALAGGVMQISPTGFLIWTGLFLFLSRHAHRFLSNNRRIKRQGERRNTVRVNK